jgi:hypothetical protein
MKKIRVITNSITLTTIFLMILLSITPIISSETINGFDNEGGVPDVLYTLKLDTQNDIATEATGYFTIPSHRGEIKQASLKIKCSPDEQGSYLLNPALDIGVDGDYEWRYSGKGYGEAGHQNVFSSGFGKRSVITAKRGIEHYDDRTDILLPTTANIQSASMKIKGGPGQFKDDLVVAMYYNGNIYYTKSNGDGTFSGVTPYYDVSFGYTYGVGLGDFDNDNDLDIVYGEGSWGWNNINFFIINNVNSNPHPWGTTPNSIYIGSIKVSGFNYYPYDIAVEDFDNDGFMDFVGSVRSGSLYFFKGRGDLSFDMKKLPVTYPGSYSLGKDAADINNDGNMDFVAGGGVASQVFYYEGIGNGSFKPGVGIASGTGNNQYGVVTADFNDDYDVDIITKGWAWGTGASTTMKFIEGNGDGTFDDPIDTNIDLGSWSEYGVSDGFDFNYDGYQDIVVKRSSSLYYYEGKGSSDFKTGTSIGSIGWSTYAIAAPPRMPLGGCQNLSLDIGNDGSSEKTFSGIFDNQKTQTITFKDELNSLLSSSNNGLEVVIDDYGNKMYKVPLKFKSDTIGSVQLEELDIRYDYTAKVEILPEERYNLTTDLNDLLLPDTNESRVVPVYFGVYSDTPGKVKLSDLVIEYNAAPERNDIPMIVVDEGSDTKALNLTKLDNENIPLYFSDDFDSPEEMTYGIYTNSDPEHLELSVTEDKYLRVNTNLDPDWHGSAWVRVWCRDSEGIETLSNEFELRVTPVDDPPVAYKPFPRVNLRENETRTVLDLDDPDKEYFVDVDSNKLYFRAVLMDSDTHAGRLTMYLDHDTNRLSIRLRPEYRDQSVL